MAGTESVRKGTEDHRLRARYNHGRPRFLPHAELDPAFRPIACRAASRSDARLAAAARFLAASRLPLATADSTGRFNALGKAFCRRFEAERFSGSLVQPSRDRVEPDLIDTRQVHSFLRRGDCWDNAAMESFFSTLKTERTDRKDYRTRDEAKGDVFDYIERFYNPRRRHSTLGYLSPMEFEKQTLSSLSRCPRNRSQASWPILERRLLTTNRSRSQMLTLVVGQDRYEAVRIADRERLAAGVVRVVGRHVAQAQ